MADWQCSNARQCCKSKVVFEWHTYCTGKIQQLDRDANEKQVIVYVKEINQ